MSYWVKRMKCINTFLSRYQWTSKTWEKNFSPHICQENVPCKKPASKIPLAKEIMIIWYRCKKWQNLIFIQSSSVIHTFSSHQIPEQLSPKVIHYYKKCHMRNLIEKDTSQAQIITNTKLDSDHKHCLIPHINWLIRFPQLLNNECDTFNASRTSPTNLDK